MPLSHHDNCQFFHPASSSFCIDRTTTNTTHRTARTALHRTPSFCHRTPLYTNHAHALLTMYAPKIRKVKDVHAMEVASGKRKPADNQIDDRMSLLQAEYRYSPAVR